jgi:GTP-binding protein YchF
MVYHVSGSVDAVRDIDFMDMELMLSDLIFTEKRLEKIDKDLKRKEEKEEEKEKALLLKFKEQLEKNAPLRTINLDQEHKKIISSYPLITLKPLLIVLNVGEGDLKKQVLASDVVERYKKDGASVAQVSAKIEDELMQLGSKEEEDEFLKDLGVEELAIDRLTRLLYEALGLVSFFTTVNKEARAWAIRKGSSASQAAGIIHSDMEKGFIRAEIIKYKDLIELGSEAKVREAGRLMVKGKEHIIEDGDILNIRFSV